MDLYIIRDGAFTLRNGKPASNLLHYDAFGKRYLEEFERVYLVGRLFNKDDPSALPVEGPGVKFIPLPGRRGLIGFMAMFLSLLKFSYKYSQKGNAYILRIPGNIPSVMGFFLRAKGIPFSVEVAADPFDSYSKKALDGHLLSGFIQNLFVRLVKLQCKQAETSSYVTKYSLQERYPPRNKESSFGFPSIDLRQEAYAHKPKDIESFKLESPHLVLTGNMQGSMKGHDILIKSLKIIRNSGINARLTIIGFGNNTSNFKQMCKDEEVDDVVTFTGKLSSGDPIRQILKDADLFVLPSRQEGLPRALLEAMSMGLPAVATRVGGVPELLDAEAIVEPDSVSALSQKLIDFLSDSEILASHAKRNHEVALSYHTDKIRLLRNSFLKSLKNASKG